MSDSAPNGPLQPETIQRRNYRAKGEYGLKPVYLCLIFVDIKDDHPLQRRQQFDAVPYFLTLVIRTPISMATPRFNFNVSYSELVNRPGDEPVLSMDDVWQGIAHGARHPDDMAQYVASCEILSGDKLRFRRKLIIGGGGAVHTGPGQPIEQDCVVRPGLNVRSGSLTFLWRVTKLKQVEATTTDSGSTTIFGMSQGTQDPSNPDRPEIFFTGVYELWIDGIKDGSKEAEDVRVKYGALARGATEDGVKTFRRWKVEGKLDQWKKLENGT